MRKTKSIKIDDTEITVKELRVKDIRAIIDKAGSIGDDVAQIMDLLPLIADLPPEKLDEMAPSEIGMVWEAAKEVNAFLIMMEKSGIVKALKNSILENLTASFAELSNPGT